VTCTLASGAQVIPPRDRCSIEVSVAFQRPTLNQVVGTLEIVSDANKLTVKVMAPSCPPPQNTLARCVNLPQ
jgi:hypothetical protein